MVAQEHVLLELDRLIILTAALLGDHLDKHEFPAAGFAEDLLALLHQTKRLLSSPDGYSRPPSA